MEETKYRDDLNPFTAVWFYARGNSPVRHRRKTERMCMAASLGNMSLPGGGDGIPGRDAIIFTIIPGPIAGIIGAAFTAGIFLLVGKLFKGTGTYSDLFGRRLLEFRKFGFCLCYCLDDPFS